MNRKPVKRNSNSKVFESNADMPKTPKVESECYHLESMNFSTLLLRRQVNLKHRTTLVHC